MSSKMTVTKTSTHTKTNTKTKTETFEEDWVNVYRFKYPVLMHIGWDVSAQDTWRKRSNVNAPMAPNL